MSRWLRGIRWKIVWLFFLSAALSVATSFLLYLLALWLHYSKGMLPLPTLFRTMERNFGAIPVLSIAAVALFICFVILLSWRHIRYLVQISEAVQLLAQGKLEHRIPVRTKDELGELANNINQMSGQLLQSIEEERLAVKGKNELITNVSHDLRTPLTSIMGYLQLIDEDRYRDEVELRHYVNITYEKSRRLNRLVNDLFEYTRMGYGQTILTRNEINIIELIGQIAADFSLQLQEADMELQITAPDEKVMISADGDKLMRVFDNLISNAMKYGKEGKNIHIKLEKEASASVVVQIVNYGPPIPAHDLPYIFERLYRVEKSRSDETGGTGLGLAIVKSIIELHQGSITITSDEHETVFEVRLPI